LQKELQTKRADAARKKKIKENPYGNQPVRKPISECSFLHKNEKREENKAPYVGKRQIEQEGREGGKIGKT